MDEIILRDAKMVDLIQLDRLFREELDFHKDLLPYHLRKNRLKRVKEEIQVDSHTLNSHTHTLNKL